MSRRTRRSSVWSLAVLVALLAALMVVAAGCGDDDDSSSGGDNASATDGGGEVQKVDLLLSYQRSIAFIGEIIAQENGYFADENLEVKPIATEGGQFVVQQVIAGNQKFGLAGAQNVDVGISQGSKLKAIWEHDRDIILIGTPADGGVDGIPDLEGKALGITDPGSGEVNLINGVLEEAGIRGKVDMPAVGPGGPAAFAALESGKIAAYSGYTNDLAAIEAEGLKMKNILPENFKGLPNNTLFMSEETYNNPDDLETAIKIARAWNRGTVFALNDPEAALKIGCEYVPEECKDMNVARAFMNATLNGIKPREGSPLGTFDYPSLEQQAGLLSEQDLGPEPIDFETVFPNDHIEEIDNFDEPKLEPDAPQLLDVKGGGLAGEE
jgi:ABC-type nitrate/sulfonate/bicarbonate transport system substrate-binding protein